MYILITVLAVLVFCPGSGTVLYGQDSKNEPTLGQRFKNAFKNIFSDDEEHHHNSTDVKIGAAVPSATPMKPPKPITAAEVKQAQNIQANSANSPKVASTQRDGTARHQSSSLRTSDIPSKLAERAAQNAGEDEDEETVFNRLRAMRQRVFTAESIDPLTEPVIRTHAVTPTAADTTVPDTNDPFLTASRAAQTVPENQQETQTELRKNTESVKMSAVSESAVRGTNEKRSESANRQTLQKIPRRDTQTDEPNKAEEDSLQGTLKVNAAEYTGADTNDADKGETRLTVSPRLELTTEGPPRTIVGQEAAYKIRITNSGNAAAEQVSLTAEVPNWIEIRQAEVTGGKAVTVPRDDNPQISDLTWKVSRIEAGKSELLVLRLIPQQRKTVDLRMKYDFYRPTAVAKIEVEEPVLTMELQGPDEVLWGSEVLYALIVRNTGNGNAEEVHLELLQTGSDMKACVLPVLRAGEEQPIEIRVWTGKQEHIDINVQANGKYNLKANIAKRISVRRPNLELRVDTPSILFLGNTAEFALNIRNNGNAAAKDFEIKSQVPLGTQFVSCSNGGEYDPQKSQVVWKVQSLAVGETFAAKIVCNPKTEGECKLDTVISDHGGVLAENSGSFIAEAVVALKLDVDKPQRPVEVGKEAVYTICIKNEGTKTAENVEVSMVFDWGLEPIDVEGGDAFFNGGQVLFDKKPSIPAGQELVFKVKAKADRAENIRVRTDVVCKASNVHLVNEHATYFYEKKK
ncbi:MAG: DUF11 domain-containing protein [Planctomycetaceae bacterium]|nr:DUF11 domain-containing protein [Planctomycetaceae bacterium]